MYLNHYMPFQTLYNTRNDCTQRNATQRNATQRNATQRNATQRNATQRNATQRNATQRNATQRNATQRNETKALGLHVVKWNIRRNMSGKAIQDVRLHNDLLYSVILFVGRTICVAQYQWLYDATIACWLLCGFVLYWTCQMCCVSDQRVPLNFRGITLSSQVYKIYCSILNDRLMSTTYWVMSKMG